VNELLALLMDSIDFASGGSVDGYALKIGLGFIGGVAKDVNLDTPCAASPRTTTPFLSSETKTIDFSSPSVMETQRVFHCFPEQIGGEVSGERTLVDSDRRHRCARTHCPLTPSTPVQPSAALRGTVDRASG
jgi:hypothetical protein